MLFNKNHADASLAKQILKSIVSIGCDYSVLHHEFSKWLREIPKHQDDSISLPPSGMVQEGLKHLRLESTSLYRPQKSRLQDKATNLGTSC